MMMIDLKGSWYDQVLTMAERMGRGLRKRALSMEKGCSGIRLLVGDILPYATNNQANYPYFRSCIQC